MLNSKKGVALDHYLLSHPEELTNLSAMNSIQQVMRLGEIAGGLGKQKEIKQSSAPDPIETVKGTSSVTAPEYKDGMSDDDYFKMRRGKKALKF